MTKAKRTVIARDRTFTFDGEKYQCIRLGPYQSGDNMWEVYRVSDGRSIAEEFQYLSQVREYVDSAAANGWPLIDAVQP